MTDELDTALAAIARDHHGLFHRGHLGELGVSPDERRHRLATGRWQSVRDSVYRISGAPITWEATLLAACWAGGTRAVASGRSALELHQLPGRSREILEMTCPRGRRARHDGLVVHESRVLKPEDMTTVDAIPCITVERALFELAAGRRSRTLDLAVDAALRRQLTTLPDLARVAARIAKRGRKGSSLFRSMLDERTPNDAIPESAPERLLAQALVERGLTPPVPQYVVRDAAGEFVARVDLAYPDDRILIEYESIEHHTGALALVRDSARRNSVIELGYVVLSATVADLRDDGRRLAASILAVRTRAA